MTSHVFIQKNALLTPKTFTQLLNSDEVSDVVFVLINSVILNLYVFGSYS